MVEKRLFHFDSISIVSKEKMIDSCRTLSASFGTTQRVFHVKVIVQFSFVFYIVCRTQLWVFDYTHAEPYRFQFALDKWSFGSQLSESVSFTPFVVFVPHSPTLSIFFKMNQLASKIGFNCEFSYSLIRRFEVKVYECWRVNFPNSGMAFKSFFRI